MGSPDPADRLSEDAKRVLRLLAWEAAEGIREMELTEADEAQAAGYLSEEIRAALAALERRAIRDG